MDFEIIFLFSSILSFENENIVNIERNEKKLENTNSVCQFIYVRAILNAVATVDQSRIADIAYNIDLCFVNRLNIQYFFDCKFNYFFKIQNKK